MSIHNNEKEGKLDLTSPNQPSSPKQNKEYDPMINKKSNLMEGKKGLIFGVANSRSIAWGVAKKVHDHGAELCMTYSMPTENAKNKVGRLAKEVGTCEVLYCNVTEQDSVDSVFEQVKNKWGKLDFLVHSIAFSDRNELTGPYLNVSLNNFLNSMHVSCYSLTQLVQKFLPLMKESSGGSVVTMSYIGAERVIPHYNVMGVCKAALEASVRYLAADLGKYNIRVNAISAGPIRTLAAAGIGDMNYIMDWNLYNSPLGRNTSQSEVGNGAMFLLSDLSSGTTGEVIHIDSGYHIVGMKSIDAPDIETVRNKG